MEISPPFGYREVVPMLKTQKVRLPAPGEVPAFARGLNAIPISYSEFGPASHDYPIVFTSGDNGATVAPVAVLGMSGGENLFVDNGVWSDRAYVPAYARRYPFCMARVTREGAEQKERLICVEKEFADPAGEAMFDDKGEPLAKWTEIEKLLSEYEKDLERCREMCRIVSDYRLFEPFTMQATPPTGGALQLTGMYRVTESKIEHLNTSQLKNLVRKGMLARIYAHLVSLDNFNRLLERRGAATSSGPASR